jgi:hypothetical protein
MKLPLCLVSYYMILAFYGQPFRLVPIISVTRRIRLRRRAAEEGKSCFSIWSVDERDLVPLLVTLSKSRKED